MIPILPIGRSRQFLPVTISRLTIKLVSDFLKGASRTAAASAGHNRKQPPGRPGDVRIAISLIGAVFPQPSADHAALPPTATSTDRLVRSSAATVTIAAVMV
jgi:hypothetical protein